MIKSEYLKMSLLEDSHFWFIGKRFFIKTYLSKIKSKIHNILDIGSGTGGATKFLQKYGNVIGLERNSLAIFLARKKNLNIVQGEAEKLPFKKNTFDLVTVFDVLYHRDVQSIKKAINELSRVLRHGGYVLITDSAFNFLKSTHSAAVYENRRFTLLELENILRKNNIKVIKSSYIYVSIFPIILLKRIVIDKLLRTNQSDLFQTPSIVNNILILLLKLESVLSKYFKFPFGSSLIILAQKNEAENS